MLRLLDVQDSISKTVPVWFAVANLKGLPATTFVASRRALPPENCILASVWCHPNGLNGTQLRSARAEAAKEKTIKSSAYMFDRNSFRRSEADGELKTDRKEGAKHDWYL